MKSPAELPTAAVIAALKEQIETEKLNLEANLILGNQSQCMAIKHKIADAKIKLLTIRGYLPL